MTHLASRALRSSVLAILLGAGIPPAPARAAEVPAAAARSALGDLSPFRTIASDTLAIVDKGDVPAARARVKDLETAWDKAEPTLKPKDKGAWTRIDKLIDDALTDLRSPAPKAETCAASLRALIRRLDGVDKA